MNITNACSPAPKEDETAVSSRPLPTIEEDGETGIVATKRAPGRGARAWGLACGIRRFRFFIARGIDHGNKVT